MREGIALRAGPLSYRPSGTGRIGGYFPGISCQATIVRSLRDGSHRGPFSSISCQATFIQSLRDKPTPQTPRVFPGLVLRLTASARRCE